MDYLQKNKRVNYYKIHILLLFISFGTIYLCTMPITWITGDPAVEVKLALNPTNYLRSNHLLLTTFYTQIFDTMKLFGYDGLAFIPLQIFNVLAGVCCIILMYILLIQFTNNTGSALLGALTLGLSSCMWLHSTTVETGILSQFFLLSSFTTLFKNFRYHKLIIMKLVLSSILFSTAILLATNVVFLLPSFLLSVHYFIDQSKKIKFKKCFYSLGIITIFVSIPYLYAIKYNELNSLSEVYNWITYHSAKESLSHISFGIIGMLRAISGSLSSIVTTENYATIIKVLLLNIKTKPLEVKFYLKFAIVLIIGSIFFSLMVIGFLKENKREIIFISLTAITLNFIFCSFWLGSDPQFWIPVLPFILLIAVLGLKHLLAKSSSHKRITIYLLYIILLLLLLNYNYNPDGPTIVFPQGEEAWQKAKYFNRIAQKGDSIIHAGSKWPSYIPAFNSEIEILSLVYSKELSNLKGKAFLISLERYINNVINLGGKVYIDNFEEKPHISSVGTWEIIKSSKGVSRKELRDHLLRNFTITPLKALKLKYFNIATSRE